MQTLTVTAQTTNALHPVILSGGSGTRLWPLSRSMYPKQFIRFFNGQGASFLGSTLKRLRLTSFDNGEGLLETIKAHGLAPSLEELDLSDSTLDEQLLPHFEDHAPTWQKLKRLVVRDTRLNEKALKRLKKLGPTVLGEPGERYLPQFRYVVGME